MLITMKGAWLFYQFLGVVEVALTMLIVWHAWNWPASNKRGDKDRRVSYLDSPCQAGEVVSDVPPTHGSTTPTAATQG
jgi:hypothetical protein